MLSLISPTGDRSGTNDVSSLSILWCNSDLLPLDTLESRDSILTLLATVSRDIDSTSVDSGWDLTSVCETQVSDLRLLSVIDFWSFLSTCTCLSVISEEALGSVTSSVIRDRSGGREISPLYWWGKDL